MLATKMDPMAMSLNFNAFPLSWQVPSYFDLHSADAGETVEKRMRRKMVSEMRLELEEEEEEDDDEAMAMKVGLRLLSDSNIGVRFYSNFRGTTDDHIQTMKILKI